MKEIKFTLKSFDGLDLYFHGWQVDQDAKGIICLVHGLGEHCGRYAKWAGLLNEAGYAVLSFDLRGHGKSGGQRGHVRSFEDYYQDIDILIKEGTNRYPGIPCFLYGHSLGGIISVNYVLRRKPKLNGVIITALAFKTPLAEQKGKVVLSKILGSIAPSLSLSSGLIPETISRDADVVARYKNDPLVHDKVSVGWGKGAMEAIDWAGQHANEWSLPVLFMHGEKDILGYAEGSREFASKIHGDCTLKIWPGMFHEVHNEPENMLVFTFLNNWLDSHNK
jgi:alpha-beta hydrolase superfamily lysophospholipase